MKTTIAALAIPVILVMAGWVMNIIAIVHGDFTRISGLLIMRIIGVFLAPLGSLLGWFF